MRIAVVGVSHETNTFSPHPTTAEAFRDDGTWRSQEIWDVYGDALHMITGFRDAAREQAFEAVPLVYFRRPPAGAITRDAAQMIGDEIVTALEQNGPFDAVLMAQHGAAVSLLDRDFDGYLMQRVRKAVGATPIGGCFDLHANVSQRVIDALDIAVYYRTNPHIDARERGLDCGRLVAAIARGEIKPSKSFVKLPMAIIISHQDTSEEPLKGIQDEMEKLCGEPGVLTMSLVQGYPYADVEAMGVSVYAATDNDPQRAERLTRRIAERLWSLRRELNEVPRKPEGVFSDYADARFPIGLLDIGDNVGGGSTGDSTVLLHLARREKASGVLGTLFDPESVQRCVASGVGTRVNLQVGGKLDGTPAGPFRLDGVVRTISDGKFEDRKPTHGGYRHYDAGTTAVVETDDGIAVALISKPAGNSSPEQMYALGIDPEKKRYLLLRGVNSPRAGYGRVCRTFVPLDTPGLTVADYRSFTYHHRPQPMYAFEPDTEWSPGGPA